MNRRDRMKLLIEDSAEHRDKNILDGKEYVEKIDLNLIDPNPFQPRKEFDEEALRHLGENIKSEGLDQPITVIKETNGRYTLVAGERRLRASKLVELENIKSIVVTLSEEKMRKKALWENILREDLSIYEKYLSIRDIQKEEGIVSIEDLAESLNMSKRHLYRIMSLRHLDDKTLALYREYAEDISISIIETLSSIEDDTKKYKYLKEIVDKKLSRDKAIEYIQNQENPHTNTRETIQAKTETIQAKTTKFKYSLSINRRNIPKEIDNKIKVKLEEIKELIDSAN